MDQLLPFSLISIYSFLIHLLLRAAFISARGQKYPDRLSPLIPSTSFHLHLVLCSSPTPTHPPVSLIPSSFTVWQFPYLFVSVICAGSHTLIHAFTVCDWWLDKGLRMERSGWQSSNRKFLSVQWVLFMNLQPIFVCLQLHLLATTQSDTQAKCSDTSGDSTCHIRGLFVNRLSL